MEKQSVKLVQHRLLLFKSILLAFFKFLFILFILRLSKGLEVGGGWTQGNGDPHGIVILL